MGVKREPTRGVGCVARALGERDKWAQNTMMHMYENVTVEPAALCANSRVIKTCVF